MRAPGARRAEPLVGAERRDHPWSSAVLASEARVFSILHISDLHRSPRDPITNAELISALVGDRERYTREDPAIAAPDAIVVSGDIIQGVSLRTANHKANLAEQYRVAEEFLAELTRRFVGGDRARVVIVPGNHDIDWNEARRAMELVGVEDAPRDVFDAIVANDSPYRWSWKTRELYRIADAAGYARRLDSFWEFFERFYAGVPDLFRVRRGDDANLFRLCGGRIGVAAFSSCHGNDCFAFHGSIPGEVVARAHLDLGERNDAFDLRIAVWHHSIEGPPYRTDYMDVETVRGMIGRGFRMGLYGHQHKAQAAPQHVFLPDRESMAVVSAGSLCAGASELPPGVHRQYNVIEIAPDFRSARVHVREMTAGNLFSRASLRAFGGRSFVTLDWEPPKDAAGRTVDVAAERVRAATEHAEAKLKEGDARSAITALAPHADALGEYGRRLLLEAATRAEAWPLIIRVTDTPRSIEELVQRVGAFLRSKDPGAARGALDAFSGRVSLPPAIEQELRTRIASEAAIRS